MTQHNSEQQETLELVDFVRDLTNSFNQLSLEDASIETLVSAEGQVSFRIKGRMNKCFENISERYRNLVIGTKIPLETV